MTEDSQVSPMTAQVSAVLKEGTVAALLEDYGKFLLKHGKVETVEEAKTKVGQVLSTAMDRGDANQATLAHMERWFSKQTVHTELTKAEHRMNKLIGHILGEELPEVLPDFNVGQDDPMFADIQACAAAYAAYEEKMNVLVTKYGATVKQIAMDFISAYSQLFDEEFLARINAAKVLA